VNLPSPSVQPMSMSLPCRHAPKPASINPIRDPIPKSVRTALQDPNWRAAKATEYDTLQRNRTWRLVDRPPGANVVTGKWIFKHKLNPDGSLERYKARWVVRGFTQQARVDFEETFSPVVKHATIRTILTIAASRCWPTK
jgi:histone deacetylase 1/2